MKKSDVDFDEEELYSQMNLLQKVQVTMRISAKPMLAEQPPVYCVQFSNTDGENFKVAQAFKELTKTTLAFAVDDMPAME